VDAWFASALRASRSQIRLSASVPGRRLLDAPPGSGGSTPPQALSLRSGFFCPGPSTLIPPHPTHSWAQRDFADHATYTRCLRCAGVPRRPPSGSELWLLIPSRHAVLYALGEIEIRFLQITDFHIGLRLVLRGSALPGILPSASSRARFRGFLVRISLRPVQLLASLDGSDQDLSQPQRLLHPGFPRVSHLSRCWISLRQSLECSVGGTFTH
jgi:hypothetical protein